MSKTNAVSSSAPNSKELKLNKEQPSVKTSLLIYGTLPSLLEKIKYFDTNKIEQDIWGFVLRPINNRNSATNIYYKLVNSQVDEKQKASRKFVKMSKTSSLPDRANRISMNIPLLDALHKLVLPRNKTSYVICMAYKNKDGFMSDYQIGMTGRIKFHDQKDDKTNDKLVSVAETPKESILRHAKEELGFFPTPESVKESDIVTCGYKTIYKMHIFLCS